jgi:hypothetical protein
MPREGWASEAQRRFMWAQHPDIAQRWSDEFKKAGISEKGLPHDTKGGHVAKKRPRFADIADTAARDGVSVREAARRAHHRTTHRAAPDGSNAMPVNRNRLAADLTAPEEAVPSGRGGAKSNHMKKALEMLMKARKHRGGPAKKARAQA